MNQVLTPIVAGLLVIAGVTAGRAQVTVSQRETDDSFVHTLVISPAAEPQSALRYQFWPPLHVQKQTNAMPFFSRAVLMSTTTRLRNRDVELTPERYDRWFESDWKPEHGEEIDEFLSHYSDSLAELERATDCMLIDYPIVDASQSLEEIYALLLPEVQESRTLARLLRLRAKLEMHSGRWEDFTRTMQTMFRLSEMSGRAGNLLISRLVGMMIAGITLEAIEEASSIENCPNFYWALAALPEGLLDTRGAIDQEVQVIPNLAPGLAKNPDAPIGEVAARAKLREIIRSYSELRSMSFRKSDSETPSMSLLKAGLIVIATAEQSREYLRRETRWGDRVDELSDSECVLRAFAIEVDRNASNILKWTWLPESIRLQNSSRSEDEMRRISEKEFNPAAIVMNLILPATDAACRAEYRFKQSIARNATIQAIRDFAAQHDRLPESFDELTLPAWPDTFSNEPFGYELLTPRTVNLTRAERHHGDNATNLLLELTE